MKKLFSLFSIFALVVALAPTPASAQGLTQVNDLDAGDLIRGESFNAVYYYGKDGFRYVFPNDKTYFTWYSNFDTVKWLSDSDLATIQIGGNVTYRPGVKMVKINTDPKTYAVDEGGTLRHVATEAVAVSLYGANWNQQIDDVADAFFGNYQVGDPINSAGDYNRDSATAGASDINKDKDLKSPLVVQIVDGAFNPSTLNVDAGRAVKFINNGTTQHTATAEDLTWGTGTLQPGDHFSRYFDDAGSYDYKCSYHPTTMMGVVEVN